MATTITGVFATLRKPMTKERARKILFGSKHMEQTTGKIYRLVGFDIQEYDLVRETNTAYIVLKNDKPSPIPKVYSNGRGQNVIWNKDKKVLVNTLLVNISYAKENINLSLQKLTDTIVPTKLVVYKLVFQNNSFRLEVIQFVEKMKKSWKLVEKNEPFSRKKGQIKRKKQPYLTSDYIFPLDRFNAELGVGVYVSDNFDDVIVWANRSAQARLKFLREKRKALG